jgi:hypothetical protein
MSKNRLPTALPTIPVQLDLNAPGSVERLFYGERQPSDGSGEQPVELATPATAPETSAPRKRAPTKPQPTATNADDFSTSLERLKALGPRGERPHHVHLPDSLDIALRRFAADRKTKATNVLIVALMDYIDAKSAS